MDELIGANAVRDKHVFKGIDPGPKYFFSFTLNGLALHDRQMFYLSN